MNKKEIMIDSMIVLFISFNIPFLDSKEHYYISEDYLYHIYDIASDPQDNLQEKQELENYQGDYIIDFKNNESYKINGLKDKKSKWKILYDDQILFFQDEILLECTTNQKFINYECNITKYKSEKAGVIRWVTDAKIPLLQKYADKIANFKVSGLYARGSKEFFRVEIRDKMIMRKESDANHVYQEGDIVMLELSSIKEIKVPEDFFENIMKLPNGVVKF